MSELAFAAPGWAHALWAVAALLAGLLWLERRGAGALDRVLSPRMRARLVAGPSPARRRLGLALLGAALVSWVIALMQPQWGLRQIAAPRVGAEIMIALDVSRSMLAEDVAPNRLDRAKAEITDLLRYLDGDQVGLIAFAGRATVLSPLTPDFGFLRMVLESAGPQSVARGGTQLAEPIRKAVEGFGPAGELSRSLLLITDGEDHDSFPLDAAREAAEAGVSIIAIGFGDEGGSEIAIRDPRTGARALVRDAEGRPVRTRLDGEMLREIALATGGAYVPAGTGVLDLESIYARHIDRLTRGALAARGRTVRGEHYQWPVLLGLILLMASATVTAGPRRARALALALWLLPAAAPGPARAQQPPGAEPPAEAEAAAAEQTRGAVVADESGAPSAPQTEPEAEPEDPRELYNRGVAALAASALEDAERALAQARTRAGDDGELRVRAAYNLGVTGAREAEALEEEEPERALGELERAASWFREAIEQRPDDADARHNLEVTLRRALLLEDRLAREREGDVKQALEALAARQREVAAAVASLLERTRAESATDPHAVDRYRREFSGQASAQRTLLADAAALAARIDREREALRSGGTDPAPEDAMRGVALEAVQGHLHDARERMGQARSQLRRREAQRGYRRASSALRALVRAQDPLRDPVELLDAVIAAVGELGAGTARLAPSEPEPEPEPDGRDAADAEPPTAAPAWLSPEILLEGQNQALERTRELHARLRAGLQAPAPEPGADADPTAAALRERVRQAEPFVGDAAEQLAEGSTQLEAGALRAAQRSQQSAIASLLEARERFADLRGLIEAATRTQQQIQTALGEISDAEARASARSALHGAQQRNRERAARIDDRLDEELPADPQSESAEAAEDDAERARRARALLDAARSEMSAAADALEENAASWERASAASARALEPLQELRRLFFTIAERVREIAQRQLALADATRDAGALGEDAPAERRAAALAPRQETLAEQSAEAALELAALADQSGGPNAPPPAGGAGEDAPDPAETARRLRQAGEHVLAAESAMRDAREPLAADPAAPAEALPKQERALEELAQALALLSPPQPEPPQEQPEDAQGEDEQNAPSPDEGEPDEPQSQPAPDPAQLLQAVRDREAQRRRDRERARASGYEPVERDW